MVLRLGTNARRIDTGGHRVFAGNPGTQVVKTSGRDALTWLRDHEAAAAGFDHHTACYPGDHRITMGVTGDQATAAFTRYQQQHPRVTVSYSAVGSSAGIAA